MAKYGFATILEPHPVGFEYSAEQLPLHLTLIDSFEIDLTPEQLRYKLSAALQGQRALTTTAVRETMLGPDQDIPVTIVETTTKLKALHDVLVSFVYSEQGTLRYPQHNGDNYSPHVSIYGARRIAVGATVDVSDVSFAVKVEGAEPTRQRIFANILLDS